MNKAVWQGKIGAVALVCGWMMLSGSAHAQATTQDQQPAQQEAVPSVNKATPPEERPDPLKRRLSDRERVQQNKYLKQELKPDGTWKKWLDQDVVWIITDQELQAFKQLKNDEERENFVENFWLRRNPNPDSPENEYKDEHYRRIAYANEHFAAGKPGWKTDRGHIYIAFGKPDSIDSHPSGGTYQRPIEEGGGTTSTFPFEVWHYRYIPGIADNIDLEFVDTCQCNDYHLTIDRSEKDALKYVSGAGATLYEQMGIAKREDRMNNGLEQLGNGPMAASQQSKQFDRINLYAKIMA
ncbi:MAG: GWxTD domain-containing protein, partial [Terriglobus sp.]